MPQNDNWNLDSVPFKGPFKGKGHNRRIVKLLEYQMSEIKASMENTVINFNDAFPTTPRVANLRILQRPTYPLLWWRLPENGGKFFQLFNSREGQRILSRLKPTSPNTIKLLARYDKERVEINSRCKIIGSMLESYRAYMESMGFIASVLSEETESGFVNIYTKD